MPRFGAVSGLVAGAANKYMFGIFNPAASGLTAVLEELTLGAAVTAATLTEWKLWRVTAIGTATAITPKRWDSNSGSSALTAHKTWTVNPTLEAGDPHKHFTWDEVFYPNRIPLLAGRELVLPAGTGAVLQLISALTTNFNFDYLWRE